MNLLGEGGSAVVPQILAHNVIADTPERGFALT